MSATGFLVSGFLLLGGTATALDLRETRNGEQEALFDIVHLRSGGKLEGRVTEQADAYVIETDYGSITVKKADVERIEKKEWKPKGGPKKPEKARVNLPESFSHPFYAFKLYLPAGWKRGPAQGKSHCSFYGPKDVAYLPRVDLSIDRNAAELADYALTWKNSFQKSYADVVFPFQETTTIQGNLAFQFTAVFKDGDLPVQVLWTIVACGDRKYVLSFACSVAWFEKYGPRIDATVRTLRIYREPAAAKEQREEFGRLYAAGLEKYRKSEFPAALDLFRKAAAIVPEYPEIHGLVGQTALKLQDFATAEKSYRRALEIDAEDGGNHYNLGLCLLQQSKSAPAIEALEKAVNLLPDYEPALTNLGVAYLSEAQTAKAKGILEKALEVNPESPLAHFHLGIALERLGDRKGAEREFRETLKLDPAHAGAKEGLARVRR